MSANKTIKKNHIEKKLDFEAKQNLLGFFELLLKIDMRNHPERYKKSNKSSKEND